MKIALLGYGIEAQSAYFYFKKMYPEALFVVYDNAPEPKNSLPGGVEFRGGLTDFYGIDADIVVRTPAIAPSRVSSQGKISSVTKEFFDICPVPIIGVSGTKGKGTTASLIAAILQKAGIKTWLVGNIGLAALDVIDEIREAGEGIVVYELSSFQLWDMATSPHVAVLLMIEPEHLDVHANFDDYVQAKSNLVSHQTSRDIVIYYEPNNTTAKVAQLSSGTKIAYSALGDEVIVDGQSIIERSDITLHGEHNFGNVQAAILASWQFTQKVEAIREAVREFKGLPHRLEEVAVKDGVLFINDSFSSAPPATLAALQSFDQPKILIMGGYDRGLDFSTTVQQLAGLPAVKKVLLIGATKDTIAAAFDNVDWQNYEIINGGLDEAVGRSKELADSGDVVILSPGCASFDMFKNFSERGETFKGLVDKL